MMYDEEGNKQVIHYYDQQYSPVGPVVPKMGRVL